MSDWGGTTETTWRKSCDGYEEGKAEKGKNQTSTNTTEMSTAFPHPASSRPILSSREYSLNSVQARGKKEVGGFSNPTAIQSQLGFVYM